MTWIPLHVHSQYSILEASASVKALVKKAAADGLSALALTDTGNLYGAVEFFRTCKGAKIQPIVGCEMLVAPELFQLHGPGLGAAGEKVGDGALQRVGGGIDGLRVALIQHAVAQ